MAFGEDFMINCQIDIRKLEARDQIFTINLVAKLWSCRMLIADDCRATFSNCLHTPNFRLQPPIRRIQPSDSINLINTSNPKPLEHRRQHQ